MCQFKWTAFTWQDLFPFTVPRSSLHGNQAAHQECLTANPGAFWLHHPKLSLTQAAHAYIYANICRDIVYWKCSLLLPSMHEITLYIWEDHRTVKLKTNFQDPEHGADFKTSVPNYKPVASHTTSLQFPHFSAHSVEVSHLCVVLRYESNAISNSFLCRWHRLTSLWLH